MVGAIPPGHLGQAGNLQGVPPQGDQWQAMLQLLGMFAPQRPYQPSMWDLGLNVLSAPFQSGSPYSLGAQLDRAQGQIANINQGNQLAAVQNRASAIPAQVAAINAGPAYGRNNILGSAIPAITSAINNLGGIFGGGESPKVGVERGPLAKGPDAAAEGRQKMETRKKVKRAAQEV